MGWQPTWRNRGGAPGFSGRRWPVESGDGRQRGGSGWLPRAHRWRGEPDFGELDGGKSLDEAVDGDEFWRQGNAGEGFDGWSPATTLGS
jgi:hypothetical protein